MAHLPQTGPCGSHLLKHWQQHRQQQQGRPWQQPCLVRRCFGRLLLLLLPVRLAGTAVLLLLQQMLQQVQVIRPTLANRQLLLKSTLLVLLLPQHQKPEARSVQHLQHLLADMGGCSKQQQQVGVYRVMMLAVFRQAAAGSGSGLSKVLPKLLLLLPLLLLVGWQ
jgi:hypothetical protein